MWKVEGSLSENKGMLYWDGHAVSSLASEFDTPLYVYSEDRIRENYRRLNSAFTRYYKNFQAYYAIKANSNLSILKILCEEGAGADCSTPAEIMFAKLAGFSKEKILYTGNYNTNEEFRYASNEGVTINLDDISHIKRLENIKKQNAACIRINPGIGKGEFKQIVTAGPDAKFGVPANKAINAYSLLKKSGVKRFGIHMMTGSNILDEKYFKQITSRLLDLAGTISKRVGIEFSFVNIGGGLGIPYRVGEKPLNINLVASSVTKSFKEKCIEHNLGQPQLRMEPGRYIVADAGILLAKVTSIKKSYKKFVGCDAGMNTLLRPALYGAYHHMLVDGKVDMRNKDGQKPPTGNFNVCGQVCENADIFAKNRRLPKNISEGDLIVFLNCGAYGFSMSSQYNSRPRPSEILTNKTDTKLIRKRETSEDLLRGQNWK